MSKYTTGELAKLCGITVRTVQYYDTRGILVPSQLSEGGRRLYSEKDLQKMKVICFLRDLGMPIKSISQILNENDSSDLILLLLDQQKKTLEEEISQRNDQLDGIVSMLKELKSAKSLSLETISDVAYIMSNKQRMKEIRRAMLIAGLPIMVFQLISIYYWIFKGEWRLYMIWFIASIPYGILLSKSYFKKVAYLCPYCHTVFKSTFLQEIFAVHTPAARKLKCTQCGYHGYCIEVPIEEVKKYA